MIPGDVLGASGPASLRLLLQPLEVGDALIHELLLHISAILQELLWCHLLGLTGLVEVRALPWKSVVHPLREEAAVEVNLPRLAARNRLQPLLEARRELPRRFDGLRR